MSNIKIGGALPVGLIKKFLEASYDENPPAKIGDFQLDTELSNLTVKVYFSINKKKVVIVYRGTKEISDWGNNLVMVLIQIFMISLQDIEQLKTLRKRQKRNIKDT